MLVVSVIQYHRVLSARRFARENPTLNGLILTSYLLSILTPASQGALEAITAESM
jgi:hypothetical protein